MPILVSCPHCDWKGTVKDELAGKHGKCPTCGEAVQIPKSKAPPPIRGTKTSSQVDSEPEIADDADVVDDRPHAKPRTGRPSRDDDDDRRRRRRDDEDDRPRRRRDEENEERPAKPRRRPADADGVPARPRKRILDDEDDEEPPYRPRRRVEDDADEPRSRRRRFDDDELPRRRRRPVRHRESRNTKRVGAVVGGLIGLLLGLALIAFVWFVRGRPSIYGVIVVVISLIGLFQGFTGVGLGGSGDDYSGEDSD